MTSWRHAPVVSVRELPGRSEAALPSDALFEEVRAAVVRASALHGSVGPSNSSRDPLQEPDFYVVENSYGDGRIHLEPHVLALSPQWCEDVIAILGRYPRWEVLAYVGEGVSLLMAAESIKAVGWGGPSDLLDRTLEAIRQYVQSASRLRTTRASQRRIEVETMVAAAWAAAAGVAVALVAVFRTRSDGTEGDSVWLLHFQDESEFDLDEYEFEPDVERPALYRARSTGEVFPYQAGEVGPAGTVLLAEWDLVCSGTPVVGSSRLLATKHGRSHVFGLESH